MAGAIKLLQFKMLAYWRRGFSVRGNYDRASFFIVLILLLAAYGYIRLLDQSAKALSIGDANGVNVLLAVVFFAWLFPAFEGQRVSAQLVRFLFLPLTRTQFALVGLASVFLVPTSVIALAVSLSAIYPFLVSGHLGVGAFMIVIYASFSAFFLTLIVGLLKLRTFRLILFLTALLWAMMFFGWKLRFDLSTGYLPHDLVTRLISADGISLDAMLLVAFAAAALCLAVLTLRLTTFHQAGSNRRLTPRWLRTIRLPIRFGEMVKKDFFSAWKLLDSYIALLVSVIYAIILTSTEMSFLSFGPAVSFSIIMSSTVAFNIFGLETAASFERLSLAPIKPRDLFIAKNHAFALLIFSQTFFLFPLVLFQFGAVLTMAAVFKTVSIGLLYMAWGNYLSIKFPFKMNFYEFSFGGSIPDMLAGIFVISVIAILPDLLLSDNNFFVLISNAGLAVFSFYIYRFSLRRLSGKLFNAWEKIGLMIS